MADETIGKRLRQALSERGLSMAALGEQAGLPYSSIQNYAADKQLPGAEALIKIRRAIGVSIDWLLTGEADAPSDNYTPISRQLRMADYQELRSRFTNFDQIFQIIDPWKFQDVEERMPEYRLAMAVGFLRWLAENEVDVLQVLLRGREIDHLSMEEAEGALWDYLKHLPKRD